jgi:hypothetical protein
VKRSILTAAIGLLVLAPASLAHPERKTTYPDPSKGSVPTIRASGPTLVVCKADSAARVKRIWRGRGPKTTRSRNSRLRLVKRCRYRHIQAAVDAASNGTRILILPGVYREEPSRAVPIEPDKCSHSHDGYWEKTGDSHGENGFVPTFKFQHDCPTARNLIAIIGDSNSDGKCDAKCNLQLQGTGKLARDVLIEGDRFKRDIIRADRADGVVITNLTTEQGAFNDIDVVETNGFRMQKLVARWGLHYGVLSFTSDHGLYDTIEAYGNGDSGIYPGSGPEGHCQRYGIEIRKVNSFGNVLGYSGTAGNGTYTHDSRFSDNNAGVSDDSFAPGHPGMPQDCSRWENNVIASNNRNYFTNANQAYCNATPFEKRRKDIVCPQFEAPVGSGLILYGANKNMIKGNFIYDNWRSGVRLFWVPAAVRGENDPALQFDTSNGNQFLENRMGMRPDGTRDPNGTDFFWDEEGQGNCWSGNVGAGGAPPTSDPAALPACPGGSPFSTGNSAKLAMEVPCATWNPRTNSDPAGCDWFTTPPEPK